MGLVNRELFIQNSDIISHNNTGLVLMFTKSKQIKVNTYLLLSQHKSLKCFPLA